MRTMKCSLASAALLTAGIAVPMPCWGQAGLSGQASAAAPASPVWIHEGGTLELPSRNQVSPSQADQGTPPEEPPVAVPSVGDAADYQNQKAALPHPLPYLGLSVQYLTVDDDPRAKVRGFEVVGVDPNSPAEQAGIRAEGGLNAMGATGATVGQLAPPLDLIVMPLLKKAGKLGNTGDLIIAIDDNLILTPDDLRNAIAALRPGDVIYFTILRPHNDGTHETLKLPVKLGAPRPDTASAQ
ncbi:MAG TPA: PDZ domain-containing protein [Candidatus Binataceae bacterium]|jgi:hypothetical protein|nr:PDZ domain-containing protein [Candidatus Binataceae bacterium]